MYNKVILVGFLTRDIDLRYSPKGTAIAKSAIATNRFYIDTQTNEKKQETLFIDFTIFGRSAEVANQYLKKGSKVLIEGRLVLDQWIDSNGQKRYKHSVIVEKLQFMDTKEQHNNNYNKNETAQNFNDINKNQPTQNIPTIDIDEDDIPF